MSARVPRRRGETFATVAAVAESVYFDLSPGDNDLHRRLRQMFRGAGYLGGDGFELTGDQARRLAQVKVLVKAACASLSGATTFERKSVPARPKAGRAVLPVDDWPSAVAWVGPHLTPVRRADRLGRDTVFARCTVAVDSPAPGESASGKSAGGERNACWSSSLPAAGPRPPPHASSRRT